MLKVDDYLSDQAAGLRHIAQLKPLKIIAITAGKGGVGKSNVSVNLAVQLAKNHRVMLLDADIGLGNIDIMLGLATRYNLSHVLHGECDLNEIVLQGPHDLQIIPAASGTEFMTELTLKQNMPVLDAFAELTMGLDYLIIDTAAGISDGVLNFTRAAQELIVVVCDEPTSITDAYAVIKVMSKRFNYRNFHIVANMVRKERDGHDLFNKLSRVSEQFLQVRLDYLGMIPFDEHIHKAVKSQKPVLLAYPESQAAQSLRELAYEVSRWPYASSLGGAANFFLERLVMDEL
ncbi:MAG: cobyrinic acid a,c-diamide synthase [Legionella sp. 40-6]|nr:MinD/ParA family protein [Legionella sp.]OJX98686.1 MAG: cobyrinic acid a,c-diamide synthase [Legionella sp. 40-6]